MAEGHKMKGNLVDRLQAGDILVADGAMGAPLMAAGLPPGTPPDLWNVERPEEILSLHRVYVNAGAQIIITNTLGGTRLRLEKVGLGDRAAELNRAGVALAREASGNSAYVAGDIGSTGAMMEPLGKLAPEEAVEAFAEQAAALESGGVDLIWIETMIDLEEARAAVIGAREATDLPIFCSLSFGPKGRTLMGQLASQVAEELWPLGLAAIGANCGEGPDVVDEVLIQMRQVAPEAPLIAKPNAGRPELVDGQTVYDMAPAEFAGRVSDYLDLGARIVGGCCGSNPAHIAAIAELI